MKSAEQAKRASIAYYVISNTESICILQMDTANNKTDVRQS